MTKPYIVTKQLVVTTALAGMSAWVNLAVIYSNGALWDNGTYVNRDMRDKPGIVSNHARGLAVDLSYRHQIQQKRGLPDGRKKSMAFIVKCLNNADTLGIQLVIDYALNRSWRCDRGTWQAGNFTKGDWYHIEVDPAIANNVTKAKACWASVYGVSPTAPTKPV